MIRVHVFNAHPKQRIRHREIIRVARSVLRGERRTQAEVNVVFIGDKRMTVLNRDYLGHRFTTDVLSFPLSDNGAKAADGEVYVNLTQARRQAHEYGDPFKTEIARLVVHGILHLAGWKDDTKRKKNRMTRRENRYLQQMKYIREE